MDVETQRAKAEALRELHKGPEILILPNAWDVGSARFLAGAGFSAMGTTSAGIAFALGYPDGERISREQMLDVVGRITAAVPLPVTADIEAGYGPSPEAVAESVKRAVEAGAVGINIEDSTGCASDPLFEIALAVERIRAARKAANAAGVPLVINARTDGYMVNGGNGEDVFEESVRRASAYRAAGADCLFVPMVSDAPTIGQVHAKGPAGQEISCPWWATGRPLASWSNVSTAQSTSSPGQRRCRLRNSRPWASPGSASAAAWRALSTGS